MLSIVKTEDLPPEVKTSEDLRSMAKYFYVIQSFGISYYIPLTNAIKKIFGISVREGKAYTSTTKDLCLEGFSRMLITAVYLQVRDTVGEEIHRDISTQVTENMQKMFEGHLHKAIDYQMSHKPDAAPAPPAEGPFALPKYARIGRKGTVMQKGKGSYYYRTNGDWDCDVVVREGRIFIDFPNMKHLHGKEMFPATHEEWYADEGLGKEEE